MARVLLINPPFYRLLGSHYNANSLGIAYIAAVLNSHGHDAWLYNADYLNGNSYIKLKSLFDGFVDYTQYFKDENHPIWQEVVQNIIDFRPEWVGYTSYTANVNTIDILSRNLKKRKPNIKQVIGGVHATLDPFVLDKLVALDYSVMREGEYAMLALIAGKDLRKYQELFLEEQKEFFAVMEMLRLLRISIFCLFLNAKNFGMYPRRRKNL